ncbi:hypothetical protein [Streptomyces boninensis]|uniref:hypothetical protein n=1 Tax=Streptomyces boninensis TaxID=2039455 RepID=UPI003B228B63
MFEIRIICDPPDTEQVTKALSAAFAIGPVRQYATRDGRRARLYVTAEYGPRSEDFPSPAIAYAEAPSIISEIGWVARTVADRPLGGSLGRGFWLRKAAVLDRIALADAEDQYRPDAPVIAAEAAERLMEIDREAGLGPGATSNGGPYWVDHPEAIAHPRGYVRQEYALWSATH